MVTIIAHRGASSHAPQNTLAAFEKAIELGVDMVELDVHLTKDEKIVVMHDNTVDATTDGSGKISEMELQEIKKLDAGSHFDEKFAGEKVPTLEEVIELTKDKIGLNIELKTRTEANEGIEEKVLNLLDEHNITENITISTFSFESARKVNNINPDIPVGLLYITLPLTAWHAKRVHKKHPWADAAHPWHWTIGGRHVQELHELGVNVNVWTVDRKRNIKKMIDHGVDGIITNKPELVKRIAKKKTETDD